MQYKKSIFFLPWLIFLLFCETDLYSQEWQSWSNWKNSSFEKSLTYRQRIKYTTSDTYAVQLEWRNQTIYDIHLKIEVSDRMNIKEKKAIKVPGETVMPIYGGTSFKAHHIEIRILDYSMRKPENN